MKGEKSNGTIRSGGKEKTFASKFTQEANEDWHLENKG